MYVATCVVCGAVTPPAQRVQFLLGRDEECDDEDHQAHAMFCEMEELRPAGEDGEKEWKEIARLVIQEAHTYIIHYCYHHLLHRSFVSCWLCTSV